MPPMRYRICLSLPQMNLIFSNMNRIKNKIFWAVVIVSILAVTGCGQTAGSAGNDGNELKDKLKNGDLIFVGLPVGYDAETGTMDDAIASATGNEGGLNIIHVAIAEVKADSVWIIDATIAHGVDRHPLDTFLTDFTLKDGRYPEFIVKRIKNRCGHNDGVESSACVDVDAAVERAKTFCGRAYDQWFLPDNEQLYCSELVQRSYLDEDGNQVFDSEPMNFKAPDGTMPKYWVWLFDKLGMEIPQGVPGTNPQSMSKSDILEKK